MVSGWCAGIATLFFCMAVVVVANQWLLGEEGSSAPQAAPRQSSSRVCCTPDGVTVCSEILYTVYASSSCQIGTVCWSPLGFCNTGQSLGVPRGNSQSLASITESTVSRVQLLEANALPAGPMICQTDAISFTVIQIHMHGTCRALEPQTSRRHSCWRRLLRHRCGSDTATAEWRCTMNTHIQASSPTSIHHGVAILNTAYRRSATKLSNATHIQPHACC
jgi:hypothetical protein